ncbi:MAG: 2-C-methyl-D-erythritol 4-phosphate cytidylyltransferase [Oscillospiraceae bacterium]|nr:2-C-methyl-D-erythritol 4-phosphate cytidylyltransferase [Oscillospiraceae bacterium]
MLNFLKKKFPKCSAVIVAAGSATRMQGTDKVMALLGDKPLVYHAVKAFEDNPKIFEIVVVTREELMEPLGALFTQSGLKKVKAVVIGGKDRMESVMNGVACVSPKATHIAVHDGARPLVSQNIITQTVTLAVDKGAAAPAIPVKDTIKTAHANAVTATPPREILRAVQTPQIFDADLFRAALTNAQEKELAVTDDCSCVEAIGMRVFLSAGEERNIKVTTPMDLNIAKLYWEENQ